MASSLYCPPRPGSIEELMQRVNSTDPPCNEKEKVALQALIESMIERFDDNPLPCYYSQVALLSPVATDEQYNKLLNVFSDAILKNCDKGSALNPDLLPSFVRILRSRAQGRPQDGLFPAIDGLRERLDRAYERNNMKVQYFLMYTMGSLLDVVIDTKVSNIDQDNLRGPLLAQLAKFEDHDEPRLAQAASYANEALKGVSSNQGPWDLFWKTSGKVLAVTAKTAGAISAIDPNKLVEAVPDVFELLSLFKDIYDVSKSFKDDMAKMDEIFTKSIQRLKGQEIWYGVLRYTGMLINTGGKSFDTLKQILPKVPCGDKWQFWCGLYAQLEQGYLQGDQQAKDRIIRFTEWTFELPFLKHKERIKKESRIQEWINLLAKTFGREPQWQKPQLKEPRKFPLCFLKKPKCEPKLDAPFTSKTDRHATKSLLDEAWHKCETAQIFYVDAALVHHYTLGNTLKIWRISNDTLDIENCYINLGVVEASPERRDQGEAFELSLRKRLKIEAPSEGKEIQLPDLYNERQLRTQNMQRSERNGKPKRILIRGRAGVGKTTLCKKIVHDFIHGKMPLWDFDRLLWIPLRKLKGRPSAEEFLDQEIWSVHSDKQIFVRVLLYSIFNHRSEKTLLVLDGFDEIVAERLHGEDLVKCPQILNLLNHPNMIITSRPHAAFHSDIRPFDLELETVGFRPDQVDIYVEKVVRYQKDGEKSAREIREFIKGHWLMKGLLQIPIQLDALCYTWNEPFRPPVIETMTVLYQAIELKLWKKDIVQQRNMSEAEADNILIRSHVEPGMSNHIDLVQKLAFFGLYNNIVDFAWNHRTELYKKHPEIKGKTDNLLDGLSFIRTADSSAGPSSKVYYFIHLTFQEYFAAHYFVQCWVSNEQMTTVHMDPTECRHLDAKEFLQREKYNGRYNIMWRFVAGLLCEQGENEKLAEFMQVLDDEPRDLLGPTHLRILMHCFSEISDPAKNCDLKRIEESMEKGLSGLLRISRGVKNYPKSIALSHEMEFPSHLFGSILDGGTQMQQITALRALEQRTQLSSDLVPRLKGFVDPIALHHSEEGNYCLYGATAALAAYYEDIPEIIIELLKHPGSGVREITYIVIAERRNLPEEIIETLVCEFQAKQDMSGFQVTWDDYQAAGTIGKQLKLSENTVGKLKSLLEDRNPDVRRFSVRALSNQFSTRPDLMLKVLEFQNDDDSDLRLAVAYAVLKSTQPEACSFLTIALNDKSAYIRAIAAGRLASQKALPPEILDTLKSRMNDNDPETRIHAMGTYTKHATSTGAIFEILIPLLDDEDDRVGSTAAHLLSTQPAIPEHIINCLASKLKDENSSGHHGAIRFFCAQSDLNDEILQSLIPYLHSRKKEIRITVIVALRNQSKFPEYAVQSLESLLSPNDLLLTRVALTALRRCKTLSEETLKTMVFYLKNRCDTDAGKCLQQQRTLTPAIIQDLVHLLKHEDIAVGLRADSVLRERDEFYAILPDFNRKGWEALSRIWFDESLDEDWSCVLWEDTLHITTPQGLHKVEFKSPHQKENLQHAIEALQHRFLKVRK
ncbi:ARM repeat-containing protein [Aspergillus sclerotiicarbonarius CBS 121057]|uniref:ARM repeat-containing protein n=1 Tax=Aspergillus sclerotiicarbonarius (strain CBS 121057 / IBT 28362) TaxID=1448318 RepID=A0A319ETE6_ASPSB|nr:ARM repeat-containing protein [Aspergillus sclerotiicarbonarius CBS 121057]